MTDNLFRVRVSGALACFSRPEFSTERVSYEIITPSAARGVLEAILWKPAIRWEVRRVSVLNEIKWMEFRRNEVNSRVPTRDVGAAARSGEPLREFYAAEDRAQRNTVALRNVDYLVEAEIHLAAHAGEGENLTKFREMFLRRMEKGQQHYQPYLGCREFPAQVELAPPELQPIADSRDLGWMLHDLEFGPKIQARFFPALMVGGVVEIPAWTGARRCRMILASLRDMAEREGLTRATAFENKPVKWVISLDEDGHFLGLSQTLVDSLLEEGKKKRKPQAKIFSIPRRSGRTAQAQADFLVDKSEYVFGVEPDGKRAAEELDKRRNLFLDQIRTAAQATSLPELGAAMRFLESETERASCIAALEKDGYVSNDLFTFKVEGELLHSQPAVRAYWAELVESLENGAASALRQCVVCGEMRQPVDKHDALQIPGGVTSGVGLVTFNSAAFEKYGLERNENAPVCRPCMTAYVEALRRCLSERYPRPDDPDAAFLKQSVRLTSDTTAVYWAAVQSDVVDALAHLSDSPADVKAALESPWHGSAPGTLEHERFHCLIVTGSQGRAIVRSLHVGTLGSLVHNLKTYFECLAVPGTQSEKPLPIFALLRSLAPAEKIDKLPAVLAEDVFLAALFGCPLPRRVLASAVARNAATQSVTRERAALLHLYFALQPNTEKPPMSLDVNNPDPAYRLGRLLAVLEAIQYQAQGTLNRNVVNRYYSAAATRPGSVFPRMLELTQHHLAKLPNGSRNFRQKQLGEVVNELIDFSPMQTLEEQGRFALGYYHQRHASFQKAVPEAAPDTNESTNEEGEQQ